MSRSASGERPTIQDVADAAGVSVATVSRALRGLPNVALPTRVRVEAAARELEYRPDPHASRLAAGRSGPVYRQMGYGSLSAKMGSSNLRRMATAA